MASILVFAGFSAILNEKAYAGPNTSNGPPPFGDFTCWAIDESSSVILGDFDPFLPVPLTIVDQFNIVQPIVNDFWIQSEYCTATEKNDEPSPFSPLLNQHYQAWSYPGPIPNDGTDQTVIITVPQFDYQFQTTLGELDQIMVPATKSLPFTGEVVESVDTFHHWNCYNIQGPPPPEPFVNKLGTQHGDIFLVNVFDPFLFCLPMEKNGQFGNADLAEHMICYGIDSLQNPVQVSLLPIFLEDQLTAPVPVDVVYDTNFANALEKLCVPAFKSFPLAVGGSMVPIDTTALLLAGVQSISMWMIPVVIAGVGIGIFVIIRRK